VTGGAGLGLAIVKWVADAHGGTVEACSTPGQGSLFILWLPIEQAAVY
jgi:two-component system sensor histidine kinase BaeS